MGYTTHNVPSGKYDDANHWYVILDNEYVDQNGNDANGISIWQGSGILRPYSDVVNTDLYTIRIVHRGKIHWFKNESAWYEDRDLRPFLTKWVVSETKLIDPNV